ncbi:MAG: sensor domain-containing diguanylate cyclase [Halioglobus sp.]
MTVLATTITEQARLETAARLDVLDTPVGDRFISLTRMAKRLFQVPIALVSLVDDNRQTFDRYPGVEVSEVPHIASFCDYTMLGDDVFCVPDASKDPRFEHDPKVASEPHIQFYAGYPLRSTDGLKIGTLCISDQKPRKLSSEDCDSLRDLAQIIERELAAVQLATLDELTNTNNRRGFITLAENSLKLCARQNIPTTMVFMDLNKFKSINDTYGHSEGDYALKTFADVMRQNCRNSDVFARLGGDEFVFLLVNNSKEQSELAIKRFQAALDDRNQAERRGYDLSFSHGIVQFEPQCHHSVEQLLAESDAVMYRCKARSSAQQQQEPVAPAQ